MAKLLTGPEAASILTHLIRDLYIPANLSPEAMTSWIEALGARGFGPVAGIDLLLAIEYGFRDRLSFDNELVTVIDGLVKGGLSIDQASTSVPNLLAEKKEQAALECGLDGTRL